jgi:3D (Asp-Asp-Asp) domain-containing protein
MYAFAFWVKARWVWCLLLGSGLGQIHQLADRGANPDAERVGHSSSAGIVSRDAAETPSSEEGDTWLARRVCRVTAYCDRGITASGVPSGVGQCAAPADIPFGSRVYIPALDRTFIVTDRTAKRFRHNTVDIFIPTRGQCRQFGRSYLECEFTIPVKPPRYASPRLARAVAQLRS